MIEMTRRYFSFHSNYNLYVGFCSFMFSDLLFYELQCFYVSLELNISQINVKLVIRYSHSFTILYCLGER